MVELLDGMMWAAVLASLLGLPLPVEAPASFGWPRAAVGMRIGEPWR